MQQPATEHVIIREYKPREIVIPEGASNDRFFVILQGNVEILQNNKSIRVLADGDVFGIENYYLDRPYTTSAVAITNSRIAAYHTNRIKEIIYDRPQLIEQMLSSIMRQLEQTTQVAEENIPFENVVDINETIFKNGDVIIEEGTEGTEIFRLMESQKGLQVTKGGKEVGIITKQGEFFGEMSAILKQNEVRRFIPLVEALCKFSAEIILKQF